MEVWCKARAFSTAMYGLGQAMKMFGQSRGKIGQCTKIGQVVRTGGPYHQPYGHSTRPSHPVQLKSKMSNVRAVYFDPILSLCPLGSLGGKGRFKWIR